MWNDFWDGFLLSIIVFIIAAVFIILWFVPGALALILMDANWLWWYILSIPVGAGLANVLNYM